MSETRRWRFTAKNSLLATFWVAVWAASATGELATWIGDGPEWLMEPLDSWLLDAELHAGLIIPLPAALGAISGRPLVGLAYGIVGYLGLVLGLHVLFERHPPVPF